MLGVLNEISSHNLISLADATSYFNKTYRSSCDDIKIKLKCWLYYSECRAEGNKMTLPFNEYVKVVGLTEYLEYVRKYVIDCSDIGGVDIASHILWTYSSRTKRKNTHLTLVK